MPFRHTLAAALLLSLCLPLAAGTLEIGLLCTGGLEAWAEETLTTAFSLLPPVDRLEVVDYSREMEAGGREAALRRHEDYVRERTPGEYSGIEYTPYHECGEPFELVPLEAGEDFIVSLDEAMLGHLGRECDLVFIFIDTSRDGVGGLDVHIYIEGRTSLVFSSLYMPGELDGEKGGVIASIVSFFAPELCLLDASAYPRSSLLDENGDEIAMVDGYALVDSSPGSVTVTGGGLADLEIRLEPEPGAVNVLTGEREARQALSVTLQAHPTTVEASLFGLSVQLPLTTRLEADSLVLTLSAPRFAQADIQLSGEGGFHSFSLKPAWMDNEGLVTEAKDEMYRAMRNSLLSFGLYVVCSSLASIYPDAAFWLESAGAVTAGIGVVNLIDFIHDMLAYYDRAKDVYL